jgi:hypothetical protein
MLIHQARQPIGHFTSGSGPFTDTYCPLRGAGDKEQDVKKRKLVDSAVDAVPGMPNVDVLTFETLVKARAPSSPSAVAPVV